MKRLVIVLLAGSLLGSTAGPSERMKGEDIFQTVSAALAVDDSDEVIADRLRRIEPAEQFPEDAVRVLREMGAGQRTVKALEAISAASKILPLPPVPVASAAPPSDAPGLLARMTDYAFVHLQKLPNMVCTETTQFYGESRENLKAGWRAEDLVEEEVRYADGEENYRTIRVNGQPDDRPLEKIRGAWNRGEFGSILAFTFDPSSQAHFTWDHWESLHGRQVAVFRYAVDQAHSKYQVCCLQMGSITIHGVIQPQRRPWMSAYRGFVYAAPETGRILRIDYRNVNLPPESPLLDARHVVDYASFTIGEKSYWLPSRVKHYIRTPQFRTRDEIGFSNYRKFGAESTILFPTEDAAPEEK
jgi:hypothetical protein